MKVRRKSEPTDALRKKKRGWGVAPKNLAWQMDSFTLGMNHYAYKLGDSIRFVKGEGGEEGALVTH